MRSSLLPPSTIPAERQQAMQVPLRLLYAEEWYLGSGSYGRIYKAIEEETERAVALKISRVSLNVRRTALRHEARVVQLLQGHPAVPRMFGYGREPHFEYMATELLGQSLRHKIQGYYTLQYKTVARIGEQMLSALEHLAARSIVHRDIKPDNILVSPEDSGRIVLIDFGIAHHLSAVQELVKNTDGEKKVHFPEGTLHWCSVRAHDGLNPRPQDDLESVGYLLLRLALGDLPWNLPHTDQPPSKLAQSIRDAKQAFSTEPLPAALPDDLADVLQTLREVCASGQYMSGLATLRAKMRRIAGDEQGPLDWSHRTPPVRSEDPIGTSPLGEGLAAGADGEDLNNEDEEEEQEEYFTNSYFAEDISLWDILYGRGKSLTLPADEEARLDGELPEIASISLVRVVEDGESGDDVADDPDADLDM